METRWLEHAAVCIAVKSISIKAFQRGKGKKFPGVEMCIRNIYRRGKNEYGRFLRLTWRGFPFNHKSLTRPLSDDDLAIKIRFKNKTFSSSLNDILSQEFHGWIKKYPTRWSRINYRTNYRETFFLFEFVYLLDCFHSTHIVLHIIRSKNIRRRKRLRLGIWKLINVLTRKIISPSSCNYRVDKTWNKRARIHETRENNKFPFIGVNVMLHGGHRRSVQSRYGNYDVLHDCLFNVARSLPVPWLISRCNAI